jgi:DNA-binding NtrC family response regulator
MPNKTILVVDDDPAMRGSIRGTLERAGFEVLVAENGVEGMKAFGSNKVDLAIVDVFMPEKDGFETLREMRRHKHSMKILAISGGGDLHMADALTWAKRLRVNATLSKPFTREELLQSVAQVLGETSSLKRPKR